MVVSDLEASIEDTYVYDSALTPIISSVSPKRAGTGGGTKLTIEGSNFGWVSEVFSLS